MRTDVKVGLICVFAIILAVVIYFVAQGNARGRGTLAADTNTAANTPSNTPAAPAPATPPGTPSTPALAEAPLASPPVAAAATPTIPAVSTPPVEPLQLAQANVPDPTSRGLIPAPTPTGAIPSAGPGATPGGTAGLPATPAGSPPATPSGGTPSFGSPSFGGGGPAGLGNSAVVPGGATTRPGIDTGITLEPAPRPGSRETARPLPNPGGASFGNRSTLGTPPTPFGSTTAGNTHTIQKGDMLGTIAKKYGVSVKAIEAANPGLDSNRLKINSTIKIPTTALTPGTPSFGGSSSTTLALGPAPTPSSSMLSAPTTPTTPGAASGTRTPLRTAGTSRISARPGSSYTIKRGDSLTGIALAVYGDKSAWRRIYRANRGELSDANTIPVGTTIRLPE